MLIFAVGCLVVAAAALPHMDPTAQEWVAYKAQHGKIYPSQEEEVKRLEIYTKNKQFIESHNEKFERGDVSYKLALNQFADKHPSEMRSRNNLGRPLASKNAPMHINSLKTPPPAVDWRTTPGVVSDVPYMQDCESSWGFSAVGSMTSQLAIKKNLQLPTLSIQNLIDCTFNLGNVGCHGGWASNAFKYIQQNGIDSEDDYLYLGYDSVCAFNKTLAVPGANVTGFVNIKNGSLDDLTDAVATVGPVAVIVGAYDINWSFMLYKEGIYVPPPGTCVTHSEGSNHAALLVGYGAQNDQEFWIIQNFWGSGWGENGYMRLLRNGTNLCGIASQALYPTV